METLLEISQQQTIKRLREEVETLQEALRQANAKMIYLAELPEWLPHLSPTEESVLRHLMTRDQVTFDGINHVLYGNDIAMRSEEMPKVWICKLRRKLAPIGIVIETIWGKGYKLPRQFRELLSDPLSPHPASSAIRTMERHDEQPGTGNLLDGA